MKHSEAISTILYDLIRINDEHVGWYKNLVDESRNLEPDLIEIFNSKLNDSKNNIEALKGLIKSLESGTYSYAGPGKIFRAWTELRSEDKNRGDAVLATCQFSEDAALEAYKTALSSECLTDHSCRKVLMDQKFSLQWFRVKMHKYSDLQTLVLVY